MDVCIYIRTFVSDIERDREREKERDRKIEGERESERQQEREREKGLWEGGEVVYSGAPLQRCWQYR
jgi:hypothetical protein